jgi:hypothetical protein
MFEPSRSDAPLLQRALRSGWDVPEEMRATIIAVLSEIVKDGKTTARERTSAARAVVQATRVELDAIRVAMAAKFENLTGRVENLEAGSNGELARTVGESRTAGTATGGPAE